MHNLYSTMVFKGGGQISPPPGHMSTLNAPGLRRLSQVKLRRLHSKLWSSFWNTLGPAILAGNFSDIQVGLDRRQREFSLGAVSCITVSES